MTGASAERRIGFGVFAALGIAAALLFPAGAAPAQEKAARGAGAAADIRAVVAAFHKALAAGERKAALRQLSRDVVVLENGQVETAREYVAHHLEADMEFAAAVQSRRTVVQASVQGDAGWVVSRSTTKGQFRGREIDSAGAELVVLRKEPGGWKIRAIHWSSRQNGA